MFFGIAPIWQLVDQSSEVTYELLVFCTSSLYIGIYWIFSIRNILFLIDLNPSQAVLHGNIHANGVVSLLNLSLDRCHHLCPQNLKFLSYYLPFKHSNFTSIVTAMVLWCTTGFGLLFQFCVWPLCGRQFEVTLTKIDILYEQITAKFYCGWLWARHLKQAATGLGMMANAWSVWLKVNHSKILLIWMCSWHLRWPRASWLLKRENKHFCIAKYHWGFFCGGLGKRATEGATSRPKCVFGFSKNVSTKKLS